MALEACPNETGVEEQQLPRSTASLIFPFASQNFFKTLSSLKRSTLSISNRLVSIHRDSLFVQKVADHYNLPLVANERCGSWYIHPDHKAGSAYFKSTDGHPGQWSFSTRRLNLQILPISEKHGGYECIVVDSTRRGKSMPDALSKTIPIWCSAVVGASEHSQIEARLDAFVSSAKLLELDLSILRRQISVQLRPFFLTPDCPYPDIPANASYHPIICLTASHRVHGEENSENNYIQGAGDDSEGWSHGLTPALFWQHRESLMSATEGELPSLIGRLTASNPQPSQMTAATLIHPTTSIYIGPLSSIASESWDAVTICNTTNPCANSTTTTTTTTPPRTKTLHLPVPQGKAGSRALRSHLHLLPPFLHAIFQSTSPTATLKILFTCPTGTDLAVGTALVALCLLFDNQGKRHRSKDPPAKASEAVETVEKIDKAFIRRRMAWITTAKADARPSRETLQAVNTCLIGR
ncbi:MAG: hypothetical protein Q9182_001814 [Xanthomendoza sp. 2 TL-2023]